MKKLANEKTNILKSEDSLDSKQSSSIVITRKSDDWIQKEIKKFTGPDVISKDELDALLKGVFDND